MKPAEKPVRRRRLVLGALAAVVTVAGLAAWLVGARKADVAQILARNAEARGGLDAWRKVRTMAWSGYAEKADRPGPRVPFLFEQKRPNLTRFETVLESQRSVRVFDGRRGWKLRPGAAGKPEEQEYNELEVRAARDALVIDGPLLDAAAKGVAVTLEGTDEVEGRTHYRLAARLPSGTVQRVWVDAKTFLETKYDRPVLDAEGRPTTVAVYLRNYQTFEGLKLPFTVETGAPGSDRIADRLVIDRIAVNPNLPDGQFARPALRTSRRGITVDTRPSPPEASR